MAFKARVYLQRHEESEAKYIGEIDVTPRPVRHGRAVFTHAGKIETGHVDRIDPPDWDKTGTIPTIHVTLAGANESGGRGKNRSRGRKRRL